MSTLPPALDRTLSRRERTLDELLEHYSEARETLWSGVGASSGSEGVRLMPPVWTESYRKLEDVLRAIRGTKPGRKFKGEVVVGGRRALYWQLIHWYVRVERVQKPRRRQVGRGRFVEDGWRIVVVRQPECDPGLARVGLALVSTVFEGEPFVPKEILRPEMSEVAA